MTNHPNRSGKFELAITAGAGWGSPVPIRHRRHHTTLEAAMRYAAQHAAKLAEREGNQGRAYIVYGPGCGKDGRTVA